MKIDSNGLVAKIIMRFGDDPCEEEAAIFGLVIRILTELTGQDIHDLIVPPTGGGYDVAIMGAVVRYMGESLKRCATVEPAAYLEVAQVVAECFSEVTGMHVPSPMSEVADYRRSCE